MKACFKRESMLGSLYGFWIIMKNYLDQIPKFGLSSRKSTDLVHCEVWFDYTDHKLSWSSSEDDGGTRAKQISYSHKERWRMVDVPLSFVNYNFSRLGNHGDPRYNKCFSTEAELFIFLCGVRRRYDWGLIAHFVLDLLKSDRKKLVCSEAVMFALGYSMRGYNELTPARAYDILAQDLAEYSAKAHISRVQTE